MAERIVYRADCFKEGDLYVVLAPELNVSGCGETLEDARRFLQEAVEAFAEACQTRGAFEEVMEESGSTTTTRMCGPQPSATERLGRLSGHATH
jgi:hypothetical protein